VNGFQLGGQTQIEDCVANNNSQNGIFASNRNVVSKCTANGNGLNGIRGEYAPIVIGSYCESNGTCGILVDAGGAGTIRDNTCLENGRSSTVKGAGIRVTAAGQCRIERNVTSFNYYGTDLQVAANVVVMTTATANTVNYNFVAGNHYGPIIDDTAIDAVSAPAVAGLSATGDINSTSPWANFSH
jgi:parallel beta-helix repeat protein